VKLGLLVAFGCLMGLALSEGAYRTYLYGNDFAHRWRDARSGYFSSYSRSHWEFDDQFGYVYPPERTLDYTGVQDGRVVECHRLNVINRNGNIGPIVGRYDEAQVKVLVFGDSWAAFQQEGKTWPNFLQEALERRLGRSAHVVNFGRDGYGILQMFDLAAAQVAEWKPDLAVITFISDDLARARFWRTVVGEGDDVRVLSTTRPSRVPDPTRGADVSLLLPSATHEWCRSMIGSERVDPILTKLIAKRTRLLAARPSVKLTDVLTLRQSFLYTRLFVTHRNPFWFLLQATNPRVRFSSFADDARFMSALERLRATGIPWVLFHLAYYPEVKAGKEAILDAQQAALWNSLEEVTGRPILRTLDHVRWPVPAPERMYVSPEDLHPSRWGMEFYANAVADALVQKRLVGR
jgi:GDSL-like lipase/acylhydrolase family protein